jgi:hypothetical protein
LRLVRQRDRGRRRRTSLRIRSLMAATGKVVWVGRRNAHRRNRRRSGSSPERAHGLVGGGRIEITVSATRLPGRRRIKSTILSECWRTSAGARSVNGCFRQLQPLRSRLLRTARDSLLPSLPATDNGWRSRRSALGHRLIPEQPSSHDWTSILRRRNLRPASLVVSRMSRISSRSRALARTQCVFETDGRRHPMLMR